MSCKVAYQPQCICKYSKYSLSFQTFEAEIIKKLFQKDCDYIIIAVARWGIAVSKVGVYPT
jgi:hypothetical protein